MGGVSNDRRRFDTKIALDNAMVYARCVTPGEELPDFQTQTLREARDFMELAICAFGEAKLHALGEPPPGPWLTAHGARALAAIGAAQDRLEAVCYQEA
jgi:hypothetical protein